MWYMSDLLTATLREEDISTRPGWAEGERKVEKKMPSDYKLYYLCIIKKIVD